MTKVSVAGASGYAGGEALRLLLTHPELEIGALAAHSSRGPIGQHQPHLAPIGDRELVPLDAEILADSDVVILGLPHGASGELTAKIHAINPDVPMIGAAFLPVRKVAAAIAIADSSREPGT